MAKRNVVDFKIINLSEEKFQELKEAGQIDPNALYTTPDTTKERLDTLEATTVNYGNITNCITEIPQDIKLELNNGTLTLKAGSKVYVPNGAGVFNKELVSADTALTIADNAKHMVFYHVETGGMRHASVGFGQRSGTNNPGDLYGFFYNTTDNKVYYLRNTTTPDNYTFSFPIAIVTSNGTQITSIDQIFNGFGYIGSTVFALPGVKGLIPNGRNPDGSLKNTTTNDFITVKTVQVNTVTAKIAMYSSGLGIQSKDFGLNEPENYNFDYDGLKHALEVASVMVNSSGKITSFTPKTVFHAVDYSELNPKIVDDKISTILNAIYPAGSLYLTTYNTATCPIAAAIPGSTWELMGSGRALWTGNGSNGGSTIAAGLPNISGGVSQVLFDSNNINQGNGAFNYSTYTAGGNSGGDYARGSGSFDFNASRSSSIYGNSNTVQPPALVVNVWRRTA